MKYVISIILLIITLGCNTQNHKVLSGHHCDTIYIDFKEHVKLDPDHFEYGGIIPLETDSQFMIGSIERVDVVDSLLFVLDKKTETIFVYSLEGKKVLSINKKGRGPSEYTFLEQYFVDKKNNNLYVSDAPRMSVLEYDLLGNFKKRIKFSNYIWHNFAVTDNGYFCFISRDSEFDIITSALCVFDPGGNLIAGYLPHRLFMKDITPAILHNPVVYLDDTLYFIRRFDQYIYAYHDSSFWKKYYLDFGGNRYTPEVIKDFDPPKDPFAKYGLPNNIENLFMTRSYINFTAVVLNTVYDCYLNRETGKAIVVSGCDYTKDIICPTLVVGTWDDWFIYKISPMAFMRQVELFVQNNNGPLGERLNDFIRIAKKISKYDNPILVLYKPIK